MKKRESEKLLDIFKDTISQLTESDLNNLLTGKGKLKFERDKKEENSSEQFNELYRLLKEAEDNLRFQNILIMNNQLKTKKQLLEFCVTSNIKVKSRDTKAVILEKIFTHFGKEPQNTTTKETTQKLKQIGEELSAIESVREAESFIFNNSALKTKNELISLGKIFNVHVQSNMKKRQVIERIVESLVGSKINSKTIRNKL